MATGDKKISITKSAISEGTIEITKPEEQKQDISKVNRNTKGDNTNALKDEFDPKKIAERQELASLFGELGANAIHKIAEANGWKDGSPEKIAMHAALAAVNAEIVKGNITAAAITGGSTEALSNAILKAVGEAKGSSASAQWAAAVIGAALSTATGGDAQSGASIAANAIKNNLLFERIGQFRKSLKQIRFEGLKPSEFSVTAFGGGEVINANDMILVLNNDTKDTYSSWSVGIGVSVLPVDMISGKAHLEDYNGKIVTDIDVIKKYIEGGSITVSGAALFGKSESRSSSGYKLIVEFAQSNFAASYSYGKTSYLGKLEDVAK